MDSFSYLLQDIDPLLLDDMDFPINSCGKSNSFMKDLGSKINGEKVEGPENKSQDSGFVSEFFCGYIHNFKKIESLTDCGNFKKQDSMVEDSSLLPAAKRTRGAAAAAKNYDSRVPVCQVQGCYKDLRSSKDYHRKHRVCAIHAKSAEVFVNGIEKRFCQQCSRFHLLKEFDDVKRSCRKRLACHNERRRKPYIVPRIGGDSSLLEMDLVKSGSFFLREKNPTSFYYQEKYVDDGFQKIPGAKEVEFPLPFAPSLLSFNSKNYTNNSSQNPVITKTKSCEHSGSSLSTLNSFIQSEHFQKNPVIYDDTAVFCSETTERYYYKDRRFHEAAGSTLDMLHLSPHLHRVEKLQNSVQMKQENITFSCV